jgi:hypothetical protein
MTFQVELTPISEAQIDRTYRWFRSLMNTIATLQEKPHRCGLAVEHEIFTEEVRQLRHGKSKNVYPCSIGNSRFQRLCAVCAP